MKRCSVILIAGGLLAGCVNMSAPPQQTAGTFQTQPTDQRQAKLETIKSWNASGAISVQQANQTPMIMRYDWHQYGSNSYRVDLAASLNLAAVTITGGSNRVTLQKGNEAPISAATPEQLMQKNLGWSLPIPSLWYWARGLPAPGGNQGVQYDHYGHMTSLNQNGWRVTLGNYQTVQGVDLPGVIELNRAHIAAKIVVKNWQINH